MGNNRLNDKYASEQSNFDAKYFIESLTDGVDQYKHPLNWYQKEISNKGYYSINTGELDVKVYTLELTYILLSESLEARNLNTKEMEILDNKVYIDSFITGYKKGWMKNEKDFPISIPVLHGPKSELFINDLHYNYYHSERNGNNLNKGWQFVKKQFPFIINKTIIEQYGFYSGMVAYVDEVILNHPHTFQGFHVCKHEITELEEIENIKDNAVKETISFFAKTYMFEPDRIALYNILDKENKYIKSQLFHNSNCRNNGLIEELKNELLGYYSLAEHQRNVILLNEGGYTINSGPTNVVSEFCIETFYYLFHNIELNKLTQIIKPTILKKSKDENRIWFKVGLLFANGEMDKLTIKFQNNSTQIANHLGNKNFRPYISESISKTNTNDKNIFSSKVKLQFIYKYCIDNNIEVADSFKAKVQSI